MKEVCLKGGKEFFVKKYVSVILVIALLLTCIFAGSSSIYASGKANQSRAIAIVFDNSGSMYDEGDQAWCRATYAMEVFASMLNAGDTLLIYPMHPITVGGKEYTMEAPFRITDASQASSIREIFTADAGGTPIESIDCAVTGLQGMQADKKYMIVLTDGGTFSKNGNGLSKERTKSELDKRVQANAGNGMSIMYLGIGSSACMPNTEQSEYFVKKQAVNSEDVLATLTEMCNQIFGRDTLPEKFLSNNTMEIDISMSKLIAFVQGENIAGLKISNASGGAAGQLVSTQQAKYSTAGSGDYKSVPDTSLQGMMVTYTDCASGSYSIEYTGTATSVEVYYEPDADLDFVFTDAAGNNVNPNALYEGDYKVSFGMKDAQTGQLISSELLGNPHYQGTYSINGQDVSITYDGYSGEVPISLAMDDSFDAELMVTYLSGYTITKDSSDFGWPAGGIKVAARPAGELRLEISGGDAVYSLQYLEEGTPYIAKVYYQGELLTGKELGKVDLKWLPETSNVEIKKELVDDHYNLTLHYKDPSAPQNTVCGECTVDIHAFYAAKGSSETEAICPLTYNVNDDFSPLSIEIYAPNDYIVIDELADSPEIVVALKINGAELTAEDFAAVDLQVDCGGIEHTVTANEQDSSYLIKLLPTTGISEGDYEVTVDAQYTDHIGRTTQSDETIVITLSNVPLWLKIAIGLLLLIILIVITLLILHKRVLPKNAHVNKKDSTMIFDGEDESKSTTFFTKIEKGHMVLHSKYAGTKTGIMMDVKPGKESYLRKSSVRRNAEVKSASVRKFGNATIQEATIGGIRYILNEETGKLERTPKNEKPFLLKHNTTISYSGTMLNAGMPKPFTVTTKLNFKKK